jgi:ribosomal protein S18 acetylase RimI-like enzyme
MTDVKIEAAKHFSPALLQAINSLLPQLTSSGRTMTAAELNAMIVSPHTTLFIAKKQATIIGIICLVVVQMPTGLRSYLGDLVVDSSCRGRGVGRALLQAAIDRAGDFGVRTIDATTRSSRIGAISLYERVGLRRRDTVPIRYSFDVTRPGPRS